jgi:predicted ATP-dependent endonuclease of OLD family
MRQPSRVQQTRNDPGVVLKISELLIENFRGIRAASLLFPDNAVLIGDNNVGKSTILEALDLVLGPDRLSRPSPIDEHDFHLGLMPRLKSARLRSSPLMNWRPPRVSP